MKNSTTPEQHMYAHHSNRNERSAPSQTSSTMPRQDTVCRRCGVIAQHIVAPGCGPHALQLRCEACNAHIKWLSTRSPEERARRAHEHRRVAMANKPPTERQLAYLQTLGHNGSELASMLEAFELIAQIAATKGGRDEHE